MVVVVPGCVVVVVVDAGSAGAGMTVVVWAGGLTVVWEQAETRTNVPRARDAEMNFFMGYKGYEVRSECVTR